MSDPSPTIPPFIPTGPTDEGLPGQIVWDRECIYTFDGAHWGRTPRSVSSGAWDDLYTPEGGPSARFLLVSKPQSLTDLEKEQAQLNIGLLPATTESFGIVRYTDSWMDNGSGDPGDYPVTLTRHAIMELIGNKLVAGTSNVTIAYDATTGNTSIAVSGGGGGGGGDIPQPQPLPATGTLEHLGRYTAEVPAAGLDLTALQVEEYGTASVWLDCTPFSGTVSWPSLWSWMDGNLPPASFSTNTRLFVELTNDGRTVVANFKHYYTYA